MNRDITEKNENLYLNIDKLVEDLDQLAEQEIRIARRTIDEIFRAMRFQLPNAAQVITPNLASVLLTDSPHAAKDTTLNTVVISLGKILMNPTQTEALAEAVQVYYHARKITEKEYAAEIAHEVLENNPLKIFPENTRASLQELASAIMEKIINEKQSRKTPGYQPHTVLDLITPYFLYKLANPDLELLKKSRAQDFKTWISNVGLEGYDKIHHEAKFAQIQREKEIAFGEFKKFLATKITNKATFIKNVDKIRFSQTDRNEKHDELADALSDFLSIKSILGQSAPELRNRFHAKLRRLFNTADQNPENFRSEEAVMTAHDEAYKNIEKDILAVKDIVLAITTLEKNYAKKFLNSLFGKSNIQVINDILTDALLGSLAKRRDLTTGQVRLTREGGYPQKNLTEILTGLTNQLQVTHDRIKGVFSASLKQELEQTILIMHGINTELQTFPGSVRIIGKPTLVPPPPPELSHTEHTFSAVTPEPPKINW